MPVHDLMGGKTPMTAPVYVHADGSLPSDSEPEGHFAEAKKLIGIGFDHLRLQYNGYSA